MARMPYIYHSWWGYTRDEANSPRVFGKPVKVSVISWAWSRFNRNSPVFHCSESLQQFPLSLGMTQVQQKQLLLYSESLQRFPLSLGMAQVQQLETSSAPIWNWKPTMVSVTSRAWNRYTGKSYYTAHRVSLSLADGTSSMVATVLHCSKIFKRFR